MTIVNNKCAQNGMPSGIKKKNSKKPKREIVLGIVSVSCFFGCCFFFGN
jgi:hypothetical protein